MDDHRLIVADLELLKTNRKREGGQSDEGNLLGRLAQSLNEHFSKEERLLFPLLNRSLGSTVCNKLSEENAEMLSVVRNDGGQVSASEESLGRLEQLLKSHISTEENVLFWYLDAQGLTDG
jgi:hemerythrin-like domain-containing protein